MTIAFARAHSLAARGAAGLACDDDGVALGPVSLVETVIDASGRRHYRLRPEGEVALALRLAYGSGAEEIRRYMRGLAKVTKLLAAGDRAQAGIQAVLLAFPEIAPAGMAKLARAAALHKINPDVAGQPRIPAGNPGGGEWTNDGAAGDGTETSIRPAANGGSKRPTGNPDIQPIAAPLDPVQAKKERFVDAHIDDAQKAADELGIPVENILALSALESRWGTSRFAVQGNNYFGIHYPAPFANGFLQAQNSSVKVATFASYAESLKSFIAISGSLVRGRADPEAFAAGLQNSGKFGINPTNGAKVPTYVGAVAGTIRGLRTIVARRKI